MFDSEEDDDDEENPGSPSKKSPSHKGTSPNKRFRIADESDEDEQQTSPVKNFADYKAPELKSKGFGQSNAMAMTMYGTT